MMIMFFAENTELLEHVLTELQVYEVVEWKTVQAIEETWTMDICTSIFIHGGLTLPGYQALINIMSKAYNFTLLTTPSSPCIFHIYGTELPKF